MHPHSQRQGCVNVRTPAKLNIFLQIGGTREDGYHDITTVYQAINLYDEVRIVELSAGQQRDGESITVLLFGPESNESIPTDGRNLAVKAARLLAQRFGITACLRLEIFKRIPAKGGLGGGSADAAATLVGCNSVWGLQLDEDELMELGSLVGEDVPFHIKGGMAIGVGHRQPLVTVPIGSIAAAVGTDTNSGDDANPTFAQSLEWHWVLGVPDGEGLSTREVFAKLDAINGTRTAGEFAANHQACITTAWGTELPEIIAPKMGNDLERPASMLLPSLARGLAEGRRDINALGGVMSGSGSTCAFLTTNDERSRELAVSLERKGGFRKILLAAGPVSGACIV